MVTMLVILLLALCVVGPPHFVNPEKLISAMCEDDAHILIVCQLSNSTCYSSRRVQLTVSAGSVKNLEVFVSCRQDNKYVEAEYAWSMPLDWTLQNPGPYKCKLGQDSFAAYVTHCWLKNQTKIMPDTKSKSNDETALKICLSVSVVLLLIVITILLARYYCSRNPKFNQRVRKTAVGRLLCRLRILPKESTPSLPIFGCNLIEITTRFGVEIPPTVDMLISAIEARGLNCVGLYRISASVDAVNQVQQRLDNGENIDFSETSIVDIHVLTGLLSRFLRMLPSPVIEPSVWDQLLSIWESGAEEKIQGFTEALRRLPIANYRLLHRLCVHYTTVAGYSHMNQMNDKNLAGILFCPLTAYSPSEQPDKGSFMKFMEVLAYLFTNCARLFE